MKIPPILTAVAPGLLLTSCLQLPPLGSTDCHHAGCAEHHDPAPSPDPDPWARSTNEPTVLYARDGTPVDGHSDTLASAPVGPDSADGLGSSGSPTAPNARDVEGENGRLYLLELYQNAVDERDDLMTEVGRQEAIILDLRSLQDTLDTQFAQLQARVAELELERQQAEEQSYELAGRLTTAQIGRLQAELRQLRGEALEGGVEYPLRDEGAAAPETGDPSRVEAQRAVPEQYSPIQTRQPGRPGSGQPTGAPTPGEGSD